jgi:hypothetical protein
MAVVSLSHPLWVLQSPAIGRRETISIRFPNAPPRTFDVLLATADQRSWHTAIAIGKLRVPQSVLGLHQSLRREQLMVSASSPVHFRDVLETGPIEVFVGSSVRELASDAAPHQQLASGTTQLVFEVK